MTEGKNKKLIILIAFHSANKIDKFNSGGKKGGGGGGNRKKSPKESTEQVKT